MHICRCDIPVVIMGETGCGKTRLIRFMCELAAQGSGKGNLLIMKVKKEAKCIFGSIHNCNTLLLPVTGTWWHQGKRH